MNQDSLEQTVPETAPTPVEQLGPSGFPALCAGVGTVGPFTLVLGYLAVSALMVPLNLSSWLSESLYLPAYRFSQGLIFPNLIVGLVGLALTLVLVCWPARLSLSEMGWKRSGLRSGLLAVLAIWGGLQIVALVSALVGSAGLSLHAVWRADNYSGIGRLVGQLFGTALFEESLFRGILLVQVFHIFSGRLRQPKARLAVLAMLVSAIAFAVPHVPNRIVTESYSGVASVFLDQAGLILAGLVFAWIYLSSENLWFMIGVHALVNAPTVILASPLDGNYQPLILFGAFLPFLVPRLRHWIASFLRPREREEKAAMVPKATSSDGP